MISLEVLKNSYEQENNEIFPKLDPTVPMPCLKRETVGTYCETSFQNLLVEQLYIGSGNMMENRLDAEISRFNDYLAENLSEFEAFQKVNGKSQLLDARWYIYENLTDK